MSAHPAVPFVLRLSDGDDGGQRRVLPRVNPPRRAERAVARANLAAAALRPDDARGIFSARVAGALEGGRAAILRPERRRRLVASAAGMGLRPFDANLIIAIVQDSARRDEASHANPLVRLVRPAARPPASGVAVAAIAALVAGATVFGLLVSWLG